MTKRTVALLALGLTIVLAVVVLPGCSGGGDGEAPADDVSEAPSEESPVGSVGLVGLDAMPTNGSGEASAMAALSGALPQAQEMLEAGGSTWPDLAGAAPRLVAYLVRVELGGQVALFEVRADGIAHGLYAYYKAFDSGSMIWTEAEVAQSASAQPASDGERQAVESVRAAMADAFPDEEFSVAVHGYRFVYVAGEEALVAVEIGTDGALLSVSSGAGL